MNGNIESGHERIADPRNSYLMLMRLSEEDYLFEWDQYDEASDYEKFKDRLTLREWCDLKGSNYRERIKSAVIHDPERWNEIYQFRDYSLIAILNDWYQKNGVYPKGGPAEKNRIGSKRTKQSEDSHFLRDFKTLTLYKKTVEVEELIDKLSESFPPDEKYLLTDQLIRCVTSIGANIAESNGGQYAGRERYHLGIAFSSANEVRYWVERAFRKRYIDQMTFERLDEMVQELRRIMVGMFKRLDGLNGESA